MRLAAPLKNNRAATTTLVFAAALALAAGVARPYAAG